MADQIWYRDGKVSVETGNNVVVGLGTFWMTTVRVGDMFAVTKDGPVKEFYEILSVDEDRQITLSQPWQGANETNVEYAIIRNFTGRWSISADLAYQVESLVRQFKTALQNNLKGDKGDPGKDGNTVLGGPGAPTPTDGKEGDWYLDSQTWDIYRKEAGGWIRRGSLIGPKGEPGKDGVRWYYDETPSASVGNIGDINFNGTTGDVHRRTTTGWELIGNFKGPQGKQGPKGDTGPKGDPARWFSGSGAPSGGTGTNGDMYLNVDTGETYRKASDLWVLQGSIKGRVGDRGPAGPAGMAWKGAWNSSTEYAPYDAVQYTGNVWIARTGNTNVSPPATETTPSNSAWELFVAKGADGLGSGDMLQSVYDPDKTGKVLSAKSADHATTADTATSAGTAATVPWNGVQNVPSASLSLPGVAQLATAVATTEGASETLAVTPAGLKSLLEDEQKGLPALVAGENISIERNGREYTIKAMIPDISPFSKGMVLMWSGLISEIPSGWALCDGQEGRPNLLGKFIRGVPDATTNPGGSGGSDTITLSEANLPAHKHDVDAETVGHSHTIPGIGQGMLRVGGNQNAPALVADSFGTPTSTVKDRINASSSMVGGGQAFDNRPAYYELAYIIKL